MNIAGQRANVQAVGASRIYGGIEDGAVRSGLRCCSQSGSNQLETGRPMKSTRLDMRGTRKDPHEAAGLMSFWELVMQAIVSRCNGHDGAKILLRVMRVVS